MNITEKSGRPVSLASSTKDDDLIIITDKGMVIRTYLNDISLIGRDTQGVKLIKLNEGHLVSTIAIVPHQEEQEEEIIDEAEQITEKLSHLNKLLEEDEENIEEDIENEEQLSQEEE
jgi:DNA gyrase, A subunit